MDDNLNAETPDIDPTNWLDQYGDYLYRYALSRLRQTDAAEEVVQETLLAGLRNVKQFAGRGSERAWLLAILKRKIVDYVRQRNRHPMPIDESSSDISDILFDKKGHWNREVRATMKQSLDSLDREEFWQILQQCLNSLPSRQADVFALRVMDEKRAEDICKDLEISSSNYWVILHRARLQLTSCMKQRWLEDETNDA